MPAMENTEMQEPYETPTVTSMGTLVSMTLASHNQPFLDASFPAGTLVSQITTS
jgi:hypothetical protein